MIRFVFIFLLSVVFFSCHQTLLDSTPNTAQAKSAALSEIPNGNIPSNLPHRLLVGLFEDTGKTWMKNSGVAWDVRYRYFTKGWVNNWGYGANDGSWADSFFNEGAAQNAIPAIAYYQMNEEPGGWEGQFLQKTQNAQTMNSYFSDFKKLMQRVKLFNKPVMILIEPDGTGLLELQTSGNPNAYAAIADSQLPELANLPNTVAGWGMAFLALRNAVGANNAILGLHVSGWATGLDLFHFSVNENLGQHVDTVYNFLSHFGLSQNVTGSTYDVLVGDPLDRDAEYYVRVRNENRWWDPSDTASINSKSFNRYAQWLKLWNQKVNMRWVLWQIPVGNSQQLNVCNKGGPREGYQDNRTEYFFGTGGDGHRDRFASSGVISLLFGQGEGCQSSYQNDLDASGQPYLKTHAGAFLAAGGLSLDGSTTTPTTTPPVVVPPTTPPVTPPTTIKSWLYDFETDTQAFSCSGAVVSQSSLKAFSGKNSLSIQLQPVSSKQTISVSSPALSGGQTVDFHVFLPADASVTSIQPFVQEGAASNWRWTGAWRAATTLKLGEWNTVSVQIPSSATSFNAMGLEVLTTGSQTLVYLDALGDADGSTPTPPSGQGGAIATPADAGTQNPTVDAGTPNVPNPPRLGACLRVMPLGDSITLGVNGGYRNGLYAQLQQASCQVNFVGSQNDMYTHVADKDHEGHPGFTIADLSKNVQSWLSAADPNVIVLMIGTNDVAWWSAMNASQIGATHSALIDKIQQLEPNATMVVATIPPESSKAIAPNNIDRAQLASQLNQVIRADVARRVQLGQRIRLADVEAVLSVNDLYDGIHPSEAAHARVANVISQALMPQLSCATATPVSCGP